jgi:hypothetical protein
MSITFSKQLLLCPSYLNAYPNIKKTRASHQQWTHVKFTRLSPLSIVLIFAQKSEKYTIFVKSFANNGHARILTNN